MDLQKAYYDYMMACINHDKPYLTFDEFESSLKAAEVSKAENLEKFNAGTMNGIIAVADMLKAVSDTGVSRFTVETKDYPGGITAIVVKIYNLDEYSNCHHAVRTWMNENYPQLLSRVLIIRSDTEDKHIEAEPALHNAQLLR